MHPAWLLASSGGDGGVIFVFAIVAFVIVVLFGVFKHPERADNLRAAAERVGGRVVSTFWGSDRLEFSIDGMPAELNYKNGDRNRSDLTRLRVDYPAHETLRIVPEGLFAWLQKMFGAQDIEMGERGFDQAFMVQGSSEGWVREVLDPETRRRIAALGSSGSYWGGNEVRIEAGLDGIVISCNRHMVSDRSKLYFFLDHAIAIVRRIRTPSAAGILFFPTEDGAVRCECPVCATALDASARRCSSCRTPHHRECWDYFGGCAIY